MNDDSINEKQLELALLDYDLWLVTKDVFYLHRAVEVIDKVIRG